MHILKILYAYFTILNAYFYKFYYQKNFNEENLYFGDTNFYRWYSILRSVQGNGDYDKLAQGVYENFLHVKFNDSCMKKVSF